METETRVYYILDEHDQPKRVSKPIRDQWVRNTHISKICVAETHLMYYGHVATTVTTYFTGCDTMPYTDECCYLWESKTAYMHGEPRKYRTAEDAKQGHVQFVFFVIDLLRREGIEVSRRDVEIRQPITTE
jgi:hypothetical protein